MVAVRRRRNPLSFGTVGDFAPCSKRLSAVCDQGLCPVDPATFEKVDETFP
ncbi:MAG: hypothetical protein K2J73_00410 [Oscillospiraceae bacterium]|nr:hypothetical protein [Oscillospiraceae bacterium]